MKQKKTHRVGRHVLALVMALLMVVSLLPSVSFADELAESASGNAETETVVDAQSPETTDDSQTETEDDVQEETSPVEELTPEQSEESGEEVSDTEAQDPELQNTEAQDSELLDTAALLPEDGVNAISTTDSSDEMLRIFHLDCGRKYFTLAQIEEIIDTLAANGYTHIELAIGNDALRFLLDDMSVTVGETTYASNKVKEGIQAGNKAYYNAGDTNELTQADMDTLITYAGNKGIGVIPLLNTPGHMDAIIDCMESLGLTNVAYNNSARTIDVTNSNAVAFTQALVSKYVSYFSGKGCKYFNLGADEYANDVSGAGFGKLISSGSYGKFVTYVNGLAKVVTNAGMTPMAFNDGIYYNSNTSNGTFDTSILICYWTAGWSGYTPASASFLAEKGHKIINTNDAWYYVLGREAGNSSGYTSATALNGAQGTKYYDVPGSSDPDVVGCMQCLWCDKPTAEYSETEATTVKNLISTFAASNSSVFTITKQNSDSTDETSVTIYLAPEETKTVKLADEDVVDSLNVDKTGLNEEIASVNVAYGTKKALGDKVTISTSSSESYTGVISDGTNYLVVDSDGTISNTTDVNQASDFTIKYSSSGWNSGYTIKSGEYYLTGSNSSLTTTTSSSLWQYSTSNGFYIRSRSSSSYYSYYYYYLGYDDGWKVSTSSFTTSATLYSTSSSTGTSVSFTGVSAGDTSVKIGEVTYNIVVVPTDANKASSVTLEYWITNYNTYTEQSKSSACTASILSTDTGVSSEEGIEIATKAPEEAYSAFDGWKTVYYWKSVCLDSSHKQTTDAQDDKTTDGVQMVRIRCWNGYWQYQTTGGVWNYIKSSDQLVAYYLQKTEVTKEIDTYVKDWGYSTSETTPDTSGSKGQVALTVAVVYPDGTVSPSEDDMYANSTTIFNYWSDRDFGIVSPVNNEDYNVSKITVTNGTRTSNTSANVWYTTDTITWEKTTTATGDTWYNETEVWNKTSGDTPIVNASKIDSTLGVWSAKNTAKLVLIYLEPVQKETNLQLVYWDDNANKQINSDDIQIVVNEGTTYKTADTGLMDAEGNLIGDKGPWNGKTSADTNYFPDNAYITNSSDVKVLFNKNLGTVTSAEAIYKSGLYEYVSAEVSEDGKTLTFHYNLKSGVQNKTFVVDFGLPLEVSPSDFGVTDTSGVQSISLFKGEIIHKNTGNYGTAEISETGDYKVTYTLEKTLDAKAVISVYVTFTGATEPTLFSITVIPATSVYYEDSFATFKDGAGSAAGATWSVDGTTQTATQALEELGQKKNLYGTDPAYSSGTTFSLGSAHKVTVSTDMLSKWSESEDSAWPTAEFTFRGTGFDIISLTDNTSGAIRVNVVRTDVSDDDTENAYNKNFLVNNYYGYKQNEDGSWEASPTDASNALYQIPVMKVTDLALGTYKVTIKVSYASYFDKTGKNAYNFWLDGIRIYNPMGQDYADYSKDQEGYPQYLELRSALTSDAASKAVFIDGAAYAKVSTYSNYGPNHEVYLSKGQAITFKLTAASDGALSKIASVQVGAKTPNGSSAVMKVNDASTGTTISTATEMYYDITTAAVSGGSASQITITNDGEGILSLTNLKITYAESGYSLAFDSLTEEDQSNAVNMVRLLYAVPVEEEEEVFTPETFQASWNRSSVTAGQKATLTIKTSQDVESVVVNGETIDTYRTRSQRKGFFGAKTTYREFTYSLTASETTDYTIVAVNSEGVASDAITTTLTVKSSQGGWWQRFLSLWS